MEENLANIVIPIYKEELLPQEELSIKQFVNILSSYPITLACPEDLKCESYFRIYSDFNVERYENDYFTSITNYNRFMLSVDFYDRFIDYKFILICQPDSYVFRDELVYWCSKDYDYIGAPWIGEHFKGIFTGEDYLKFMPFLKQAEWILKLKYGQSFRVGNGGFSLRKVESIIKVLEKYNEIVADWNINEDNFFGMYIPFHERNFKIPSVKKAARFSIENSPEIAYKLNDYKLPFGCHNWFHPRFNSFWKKFIK